MLVAPAVIFNGQQIAFQRKTLPLAITLAVYKIALLLVPAFAADVFYFNNPRSLLQAFKIAAVEGVAPIANNVFFTLRKTLGGQEQ